jgi:Tfp pilus assembly protein PilF
MRSLLLLLIFTSFLVSCGSSKKTRSIATSEMDLLAKESYSRFTGMRLEKSSFGKDIDGAIKLCHSGDVSDGLEQLNNLLAQNRNKVNYWNSIGTCYMLDKMLQKAMFFYNIALSKAKNRKEKSRVQNNIGIVLFKMNHEQSAYEYFEQALKNNPKAHTPKLNKSLVLIKYGQNKNAIKILTKLLSENRNDPSVLSALASAHLFEGDIRFAMSIYQRMSQTEVKRPINAFYYSYALSKSGRDKEALKVFKSRERSGEFEYKLVAKKIKQYLERKNRG